MVMGLCLIVTGLVTYPGYTDRPLRHASNL